MIRTFDGITSQKWGQNWHWYKCWGWFRPKGTRDHKNTYKINGRCDYMPWHVIFAIKHVLLFHWSNIWTSYDWATWQVFGLNTPLGSIKMQLEDFNFKILLMHLVNLQWKAFWVAIQALQPIRFLLFCFLFLAMTNSGRADWLTIVNESDL